MNSHAATSFENTETNAGIFTQIFDSLIKLMKPSEVHHTRRSAFSELEQSFDTTQGLAKSIIVVHVENNLPQSNKAKGLFLLQQRITEQLSSICGPRAQVAPIGQNEYAVILHGLDRCGELKPRVEELLARTGAAHQDNDNMPLNCKLGVARYPLDSDDLTDLIRMASTAAAELCSSKLGYQFVNRHHR